MIHERPDGTKLEVRRKTPHHATILFLEARELKRDGTPHDDKWYPVSDSLLLGLQEAGSDIVGALASANYWTEKEMMMNEVNEVNQGTRDRLSDASNVLSRQMYSVEVLRNGKWTMVGQYTAKYNADAIADDYRRRGETARVTFE